MNSVLERQICLTSLVNRAMILLPLQGAAICSASFGIEGESSNLTQGVIDEHLIDLPVRQRKHGVAR
jgi:hypothetical protein